jgi:hypothetical protein
VAKGSFAILAVAAARREAGRSGFLTRERLMNSPEADLLGAFETHSVEEIRAVLDAGMSPVAPVKGKPPIECLTEMYLRSDRFPACLQLLLDRGATVRDPNLLPVLLNDAVALKAAIRSNPSLVRHRTDLVSCFTPLVGATLLHVACEYGHLAAARVLIEAGADVNAPAAVDEFRMNGHTPIFHTVNSILNYAEPVMHLLLAAGARTDVRLPGLVWGKGFEWETTVFDVTPVSYAQCGLLPQFHRKEREIYTNIRAMLAAAGRVMPPLGNVPNQYLK